MNAGFFLKIETKNQILLKNLFEILSVQDDISTEES